MVVLVPRVLVVLGYFAVDSTARATRNIFLWCQRVLSPCQGERTAKCYVYLGNHAGSLTGRSPSAITSARAPPSVNAHMTPVTEEQSGSGEGYQEMRGEGELQS
jgi:hypothetical protein